MMTTAGEVSICKHNMQVQHASATCKCSMHVQMALLVLLSHLWPSRILLKGLHCEAAGALSVAMLHRACCLPPACT